jgi:hypothetical protein
MSILYYLLYSSLFLFSGFFVFAFIYFIIWFLSDWWKKRKIPLDKKVLAQPEKQEIDERGLQEQHDREYGKYREFEKLRRSRDPKRAGRFKIKDNLLSELGANERRDDFPPIPNYPSPRTEPRNKESKSKLNLDD